MMLMDDRIWCASLIKHLINRAYPDIPLLQARNARSCARDWNHMACHMLCVGGKDNLTRAILFIIYAYATDASLPVNGRHRKIRVIKQSISGFCRYHVRGNVG